MDLEQQAYTALRVGRGRLTNLGNLVAWTTNLDKGLFRHLGRRDKKGRRSLLAVHVVRACIHRGAALQIRLVLLALGMCEVGALIRMHRQAQSTLQAAKMVP